MKTYSVYILLCADGTYYTGMTNDIDRRFAEHMEGSNPNSYTYRRRPLKIVFHQEFGDPSNAIEVEKQLKNWSVAKKEALINDKYNLLSLLSKKDFDK